MPDRNTCLPKLRTSPARASPDPAERKQATPARDPQRYRGVPANGLDRQPAHPHDHSQDAGTRPSRQRYGTNQESRCEGEGLTPRASRPSADCLWSHPDDGRRGNSRLPEPGSCSPRAAPASKSRMALFSSEFFLPGGVGRAGRVHRGPAHLPRNGRRGYALSLSRGGRGRERRLPAGILSSFREPGAALKMARREYPSEAARPQFPPLGAALLIPASAA